MGMDMYVHAVDRKNCYSFPMMYWRKHYALNEMICKREVLDQQDCVVSCLLTHELVNYLIEYAPDKEDRDFFAYLKYHMNCNTHWVSDPDNAVEVTNYQYFYGADW